MPYTLKYDDRFQRVEQPLLIEAVFDCEPEQVALSQGLNFLWTKITADEFKLLWSSAISGAELLFPEKSLTVEYLLLQLAGCGGAMSLCEQINECMSTTPEIQETIRNINLLYGVDPDRIDATYPSINYRFPPAQREESIAEDPPSCDYDILFAGILETVKRIDEKSRDMLEDVVAQTDAVERAASLVALVPLLGDVIGETILEFAEIAPDLLNAFNAHSSTEVIEDVACELFCMVKSECRYPTFDEVLNYYATLGISGVQDWVSLALQAITDYLLQSNGLGNQVVWYTLQTYMLYILYLQGTWAGMRGAKNLYIWAKIGENVPNNDWTVLCDECPSVNTKIFDFTLGSQLGWEPHNSGGNRAAWTGVGWGSVNLGYGNIIVVQIPFDWPADFVINQVRWHVSNGGTANFDLAFGMEYTNGVWLASLFGTDGHVVTAAIGEGTRVGFGVEHSIFDNADRVLYRVEIDYEGTLPAGW